MGGGGFRGGGAMGGGGFRGGGGGSYGGAGLGYGGLRGGFGYGGLRGGFGYGYGGYYGGFYGYPGWGFGYSYWPGYYDYGYYPYSYSPYAYSPYGYSPYSYDPSPNTTVIYPAPDPPASSTGHAERANPVIEEYDQYGQEIKPSTTGSSTTGGAPIYLLAFTDHSIRAAAAYWVDGKTLHYVTLEHEQKEAPLDTVDRALSLQLNRERRVPFSLPAP